MQVFLFLSVLLAACATKDNQISVFMLIIQFLVVYTSDANGYIVLAA